MTLKVPFGNLKAHYQTYEKDIRPATERVLASGHFILGAELERFERDFEDYLNSPYVIGCASGTEAIYLALKAANVGPDDEVIVVAHTAVPTISAISMTGAKPVFVDINATSYVMDPEELESKISPNTKAILPVHLYGQMVDMEPLVRLKEKHGFAIIEDVAQATGSTYKEAKAGTIGDFGAFSFYPSKNLGAFGDGGAVSTTSRENYEQLVKLRNYGQSVRYHHDIIGINSRLDEIQAAILSAQLPYLNEWNERRRQIAKRYNDGLKNVVVTPLEAPNTHHVYHLYVIQSTNRDELQAFLLEKGIQTLIHYPIPAHLQKAYSYLGYKTGDLPTTEFVAKRILSLPMFPGLEDEEIDYVIESIIEFHQSNRHICSQHQGEEGMLNKLVTQLR